MVPDYTVHLSHNLPLFDTRVSLILDITIASYSTNIFSILFLYFVLKIKMRPETRKGAPPPHQTSGNVRNGNPLRLASFKYRKGGYGKILAIDPTEANTGIFMLPFSSLCVRQG